MRGHARSPFRQRVAEHGYSLIELVAAMSIGAILLGIAVPSFRYVTSSSRVSGEINALLGDLQYTRIEAIKEGRPVSICASSDGATCSGGSSWANGWIVWSDTNNNQAVDAGEVIRRVAPALTGGDTLGTGGPAAITFNRVGFASFPGGTTTFTLHDPTTNVAWTRCLVLTLIGKAATQVGGSAGCA